MTDKPKRTYGKPVLRDADAGREVRPVASVVRSRSAWKLPKVHRSAEDFPTGVPEEPTVYVAIDGEDVRGVVIPGGAGGVPTGARPERIYVHLMRDHRHSAPSSGADDAPTGLRVKVKWLEGERFRLLLTDEGKPVRVRPRPRAEVHGHGDVWPDQLVDDAWLMGAFAHEPVNVVDAYVKSLSERGLVRSLGWVFPEPDSPENLFLWLAEHAPQRKSHAEERPTPADTSCVDEAVEPSAAAIGGQQIVARAVKQGRQDPGDDLRAVGAGKPGALPRPMGAGERARLERMVADLDERSGVSPEPTPKDDQGHYIVDEETRGQFEDILGRLLAKRF